MENALATNYSHVEFVNIFEAIKLGMYRYTPGISLVLLVAYLLLFVVGVISNTIMFMLTTKKMALSRTTAELLYINLAIADILVLIICLPSTLLTNLIDRKSLQTASIKSASLVVQMSNHHVAYVFGYYGCKIISWSQGIVVNASVNTIMMVMIDR